MICYGEHGMKVQQDRLFQTKLTYGMICYINDNYNTIIVAWFQTKLTYGMICYVDDTTYKGSDFFVSN